MIYPFVDPDLIDRLITAAETSSCDYAGFSFRGGRPVMQSKLGVFAEWCRTLAVQRASTGDRCCGSSRGNSLFVFAARSVSHHMIAVPPRLDRDDLRLAIDDEEDWEELRPSDALGRESLDWQYIAALLDRQPTMRARMARRNRARRKCVSQSAQAFLPGVASVVFTGRQECPPHVLAPQNLRYRQTRRKARSPSRPIKGADALEGMAALAIAPNLHGRMLP